MTRTETSSGTGTGSADELQERYPEIIGTFEEVCRRATSGPAVDLDEFVALVGGSLCRLLGLRRHAVYLRGADGLAHAKIYERTDGADRLCGRISAGGHLDGVHRDLFTSHEAWFVPDAHDDPRIIPRIAREWDVRSLLVVPLVLGDQVVGVIHLDDGQVRAHLSDVALKTAQAFAGLCALAVHQAALSAELEQRAAMIDRQKLALTRLHEIHEELTRAVLQGAGMRQVISLLADLLGNPVLVYTAELDVLAWARPSTREDHPPPKLPPGALGFERVRRALATLGPDRPSLILPPDPEAGIGCRHLLASLVLDRRLAGYLAIPEVNRPLDPLIVRAGEQGATTVALQLMMERRQAEARGQAEEELLEDLLHGTRDPDQMRRRGPLLGIDLDAPHLLVHVSRDTTVSDRGNRDWLLDELTRLLGTRPLLAGNVPEGLVLLLPTTGNVPGDGTEADTGGAGGKDTGGDVETVRRVAGVTRALARSLPQQGWSGPVAVSAVCRRVEDYAEAAADLRSLVELAGTLGKQQVFTVADTGILRLVVTGAGPDKAESFARSLLGPLLDRAPGLLATLRAFLDHGGRIRETARALDVHENTIRYRLSRIREVSHVDPENLDCMLDARLALRVLDIVEPGEREG